jgi:hypothetical protein
MKDRTQIGEVQVDEAVWLAICTSLQGPSTATSTIKQAGAKESLMSNAAATHQIDNVELKREIETEVEKRWSEQVSLAKKIYYSSIPGALAIGVVSHNSSSFAWALSAATVIGAIGAFHISALNKGWIGPRRHGNRERVRIALERKHGVVKAVDKYSWPALLLGFLHIWLAPLLLSAVLVERTVENQASIVLAGWLGYLVLIGFSIYVLRRIVIADKPRRGKGLLIFGLVWTSAFAIIGVVLSVAG